ncbi:MAG: DUF1003 domain-containing protein [Cyanobacteria bacterium]|nr:DUF1003 domain-containing protein [Cyanobacteriota bacterium]
MTNQSTTTTTITSTESPVTQDSIDSIKDPITKSIETISSLHIQESSNMTNHQQILESIALFFGQPTFLYLLLVLFAIWISDNFLAALVPFDLPEFRWTDDGLGAASLIISTGVLIRQTRQEKLAEQRSQLTLHLNLLVEQKTAKIISLLEELRTDLPNVNNRHDQEAHMMKEVADPIAVLEAIQETLTHELSVQELSVHESSPAKSQDSSEI